MAGKSFVAVKAYLCKILIEKKEKLSWSASRLPGKGRLSQSWVLDKQSGT